MQIDTLGLIRSNIRLGSHAGGGQQETCQRLKWMSIVRLQELSTAAAIGLQQGHDWATPSMLFERAARNPGQTAGRTAVSSRRMSLPPDTDRFCRSKSRASSVTACRRTRPLPPAVFNAFNHDPFFSRNLREPEPLPKAHRICLRRPSRKFDRDMFRLKPRSSSTFDDKLPPALRRPLRTKPGAGRTALGVVVDSAVITSPSPAPAMAATPRGAC